MGYLKSAARRFQVARSFGQTADTQEMEACPAHWV